ncbi:MAG TPA: dethiobiotin synthase [Steroidobacteraceae bacterium]|jgi:dethiobiotin synthetase|nr:dethiobiotin synthase [Steroidobacteraceae bacterium]
MSARGWFIAGTDTGVGKTRVTVALLRALTARGVPAVGMKPVAAGTDAAASPPVNEDVALLRAASFATVGATGAAGAGLAAADINPYCFEWPISPHLAARRAGVSIEPAAIAAAYARLAGRCEVVLVEGAGGWLCPIGEQATMASIAAELALPVLLVVGLRLGCLNHALLSAAAIAAAGLPLFGWVGSVIDPDMAALEDNIASLERRLPGPRLGLLPFSRERTGDAACLAAAAAALQAAAP